MTRQLPSRLLLLAVAVSLVLGACGQKAGVHDPSRLGFAGGTTGGTVGDTTGVLDPGTGTTGGTTGGTVGTVTGGATGGTVGTTGATTGGTTGGPITGDRTGITDTTITIGIHAPTTGAAPIPSTAFEIGKDLYWRWLKEVKGGDVHGRTVEVVFANDEYKPTTAVAVCKDMAENKKAFLLIGGAGTDQINACAGTYAAPRGIPYLSPGVQEAGLKDLTNYFAVTMSYRAQMAPLVQLLKAEDRKRSLDTIGPGGVVADGKITVGHVRPNTPNFADAADALKAAVQGAGWTYKEYTVVKEGSTSEAKTVAAAAQQDGIDILVPITAPTFTVQLALNSDSNGYKPKWAGVAISNNINAFLNTACGRTGRQSGLEGALFFAPWGGLKQVMAGKYDPDYRVAVEKFVKQDASWFRQNGDLVMALWGLNRALHQAFVAAGKDMTRESFIQTMSTFRLKSGNFPDLAYSPGSPFGAQNVHVLKASCDESAGNRVSAGAQWVDHPDYPGLRKSF